MSTLDIKQFKHIRNSYTIVSLVCLVVSIVYECFSHGVISSYMVSVPIISIVAGIVLCVVCRKFGIPNRFSYNAYNSAIATLLMGSFLKGVFEIAGTSSSYEIVFLIVGLLLLCVSITAYICCIVYRRIE